MSRKNRMQGKNHDDSLGIYLSFSRSGFLRGVFFYSNTDLEHQTLEKALCRLTKQDHFGWIRRLFKREGGESHV
ncbi:MAG: hypothetical protein HPY65_17935 [Syntrophaceae bacterium]|nr:hypothetical protein [Syntrophaceae bacterium]